MGCLDLEKLNKTIAEGEKFLISISHLHSLEIKRILEDIYDIYSHHYSEFLRDEYKSNREFDIIYDKDGNITSASIKWNYYDAGEVNLNCTGIKVVYKPEHGLQKTLTELPIEIIKPYFNEILK